MKKIKTLYHGDFISKKKLSEYNMIKMLFSTTTGERKSVDFRLSKVEDILIIKESIKSDIGAYFRVNSDNYNATFTVEGVENGKCEVFGIKEVKYE